MYAKFIAGEKRRTEETEMVLGPQDGNLATNQSLPFVTSVLEEWFAHSESWNRRPEGWLEYLYGISLAKSKDDRMATHWLLRSVEHYPYIWSAWQELSSLMGSVDDVRALYESCPSTDVRQLSQIIPRVPRNIMSYIFHVHASQELYQSSQEVQTELAHLENIFPSSAFLKTQRALLCYHSKDFEEAEGIFSNILITDPYRLDFLDHYSNILYVMGLKSKLGFVAQLATATEKFRPETCCAVGNYYSLKSEHEKAVVYFRRALTLDRSFLSAWTLMGHEFVEVKNTHAAIDSYRRAVDINRKDYRAWYGMGQTYEVLEMHSYAVFYYQRAAALRPYDPKMWMAVGQCFAKTDHLSNAMRAYRRALIAGSYYDSSNPEVGLGGGAMDPDVLYQLALLHERNNEIDETVEYMELTIAQEEGLVDDEQSTQGEFSGVGVTPTTTKARLWLAKYYSRIGDLQKAMELANELCQDGTEVEDAKALIRDIRARSAAVTDSVP